MVLIKIQIMDFTNASLKKKKNAQGSGAATIAEAADYFQLFYLYDLLGLTILARRKTFWQWFDRVKVRFL